MTRRKLGMHRNNQDDDVLQLVFGPPRQLQSLAGLEHGRSIPSADTAPNSGFICPRNARMGPMGRKRRGGKRAAAPRLPSRRLHGDRTEIVALADVNAVMTQNRISGR